MRAFLTAVAIGLVAVFAAGMFKTEVEAQARPSFAVTEHRTIAKPTIKPAVKQQSLADLEQAISDADAPLVEPVQATEVAVAKAAPVKAAAKKCCPDCICQGECNCSYPGECLVKSAKPANSRIVVTQCYGTHCETRSYQAPGVEPVAEWRMRRSPGVAGWASQQLRRLVARAATPVRSVVEFAIPNAVQCQSCEGGSCSNQIRVRRGWFR
jgi:hypothetical protein